MPSVPNRYYNSPWIGQAAQNLGEALFGSPERELQSLQMQKIRADMERAARAEAVEREDRSGYQSGMRDLSAAFEGVTYDERGQPTPESLNRIAALASLVPGTKPNDLYSPFGRFYTTGMQQEGALARTERTADSRERGQDITAATTRRGQDIGAGTTQRGQDITATTADEDRASRERIAQMRVDADKVLAEIKASRAAGGTPLDISPQDHKIALETLGKMAKSYSKAKLEPADTRAIMSKWADLYGQSRNSGAAMEKAFQTVMGTPSVESHFFGDDTLQPGPAPDLGSAVAPDAAPSGAAAPSDAPPANLLKEGVRTTFANKQVWTLRKGVPTRVQ